MFSKYDHAVMARQLAKRNTAESAVWLAEASVRLSMGQSGLPVADCLQAAQEAAQESLNWAKKAKTLEIEIFGEEMGKNYG